MSPTQVWTSFDGEGWDPLRNGWMITSLPASFANTFCSTTRKGLPLIGEFRRWVDVANQAVSFRCVCPFTGLEWDVAKRTVSVGLAKRTKVPGRHRGVTAEVTPHASGHAEASWQAHARLPGYPSRTRLSHQLEGPFQLCHDRPFIPTTPPTGTPADLDWWQSTLSRQSLSRSLFCPKECTIRSRPTVDMSMRDTSLRIITQPMIHLEASTD